MNLTGGQHCIAVYAILKLANDTKLHILATKHKNKTYSEHLIHSDDYVLKLTPLESMMSRADLTQELYLKHGQVWNELIPLSLIIITQ